MMITALRPFSDSAHDIALQFEAQFVELSYLSSRYAKPYVQSTLEAEKSRESIPHAVMLDQKHHCEGNSHNR